MKRYFLLVFFIFSTVEIILQLVGLTNLHIAAKPMLMISLAAYYFFSVPKESLSKWLLCALAFSWLGDVLLMLVESNDFYFMLGLASFLTAHIFYIVAYREHKIENDTKALMGVQRFRFSLPIILAGTGLISILYNHLGDLKIPVMIYALVLVVMVLNALFRFGRTSTNSFSMVFFGATLFMISDSLIAINKFVEPIAYASAWIMLTYIAAQYLIVEGLIRHKK